jgi:CBS domain-containing protein
MSVGRICCREVNLAGPDESVRAAAQRMGKTGVGTLIVLDARRRPIGIVTDRDLVVRVTAAGKDPVATPVGKVMTRDPKLVDEGSSIESALAMMRTAGVRRLPVVDRRGTLVGVLSLDDVLELLAEEVAQIGGVLGRQAPRRRIAARAAATRSRT